MASLMGVGSRQTQSAALPPAQFHCLRDELPLHLIPRPQLKSGGWLNPVDQPLVFNPQCSVLAPGELPLELEADRSLLNNFHLQKTIAWIGDPAIGSLQPFWLGSRLQPVVSRLQRGEPLLDSVSRDDRRLLTRAGILMPEKAAEIRVAAWDAIVKKAAHQFSEKGYAPIANLIHPYNLAALRRYYRQAIRQGAIRLGDDQSSRRYVAHNESVVRFFHHQITQAVSAIVGEAIKPSYVYLASYVSGAELKKHTDRAQCEFSVTLCLDFSPEPEVATAWPIRLHTSEGAVTVYQALGDGLIYRGTRVPHYRTVLPEGCTSTSVFFHYVPVNFSEPLD